MNEAEFCVLMMMTNSVLWAIAAELIAISVARNIIKNSLTASSSYNWVDTLIIAQVVLMV